MYLKILNCEPKFEELNKCITLIYWRAIMLTQVNVFFVNNSWLMIRQCFIHSWGTLLIDGNVTFFFIAGEAKWKQIDTASEDAMFMEDSRCYI